MLDLYSLQTVQQIITGAYMWSQNLERLIASDIQQLIADEVEESSTLEYKESLPAKGDDGRREFLYYVAALANGGGGFLIFGIADRRVDNKATGIADAIIGIETNNPPNEIWRMENMIRDGIAPRLTGIHFKSLDCDGISVLVLAIPNSLNAPHMVTFQKTNKFYSRVSTGKYLMSVDQSAMHSVNRERLEVRFSPGAKAGRTF